MTDTQHTLSLFEQSLLNKINLKCPSVIVVNRQREELAVELAKFFRQKMEALNNFYKKLESSPVL